MAELLFWISFSLLFYAFLGYPLILRIWSLLVPSCHAVAGTHTPSVTIVLSVYNEEAVIREKIDNFLALDYPEELLEFIIVSDRCTDRTDRIIRSFNNHRIKLLVQEERCGKTFNLNRGVAEALGEILVFTDANSMFDPAAIRILVSHFAVPQVGLVSGRSVYVTDANAVEESGGTYRGYEEMIKEAESVVTSIVGADGAIYALRRNLYQPLPSEHINDFMHTIQCVMRGYRAISEPRAFCREVVSAAYEGELKRQTRIMAQSWLIYLSQAGELFNTRNFRYLWALTSHKLLRWLTMPILAGLVLASMALVTHGPGYRIVFAAEILFILAAVCGWRCKNGLVRVPYLFGVLYLASVLGLIKYATGNSYTTWSPRNS